MTYQILVYPLAKEQILILPSDALLPLAEAMTVLEMTPYVGQPYRPSNDRFRELRFGPEGVGRINYLVLDEHDRVDVLQVTWWK